MFYLVFSILVFERVQSFYLVSYAGFVFHQVAQMTSSRVITHLFLPRLKWEWHHSSAPKQVLSCLWPDTNRWIVAEASLLSERYCHVFVLHRSKCRRGEGLGWAGRNRGYREDGEQGQILHWVPFFLPRRYSLTPKETFFVCAWCSAVAKNTLLFPPMQRRDARARMTHRAAMFPGFSNWDGPSNSCQRSEVGSVWKCLKIRQPKMLTCTVFSFTASSSHVWHGDSSGSAPAALCQVMWRVWVIRLVIVQIDLSQLTTLSLMSLQVCKFMANNPQCNA